MASANHYDKNNGLENMGENSATISICSDVGDCWVTTKSLGFWHLPRSFILSEGIVSRSIIISAYYNIT